MQCSVNDLEEIADGFSGLMSELNKEVKKGGGQRGGAPLNNRVAMQYLGCMAIAFMVLGGELKESCFERVPNFAYILSILTGLQNLFFENVDIGRINLYHTIASKIGVYLLAIQEDYKAGKVIEPATWLPTPVFQFLTLVNRTNDPVQVVQAVSKEAGKPVDTKLIKTNEPNVSLHGNVLKVRKCPATLTVTGGRKAKSRKRR
jgi:hypothetical protein